MRRAAAVAAAAAIYALVAWPVPPGFFDGIGPPQYAYVNPPSYLAATNVEPTSGTATIKAGAGGVVRTRDQPLAQAVITFQGGDLTTPSTGGTVKVQVVPFDVPTHVPRITLIGNAYCVDTPAGLAPGHRFAVQLMWPADKAPASAMYLAAAHDAIDWKSLGGTYDPASFYVQATADSLGCFALGYPTPKPGTAPVLSGSLLPLVVAGLIAIVILAGLPAALRRRLANRR